MLKKHGFRTLEGVAGLPTAVMGEAGNEGPVIAILGEYDALPGLSQEHGVAERREIVEGGSGHGCRFTTCSAPVPCWPRRPSRTGWLKTASRGAYAIMAARRKKVARPRASWCAKALFDDVDVAICWHPAPFAGVNKPISLACNELIFTFTGRASHAAASPELGRSALDAVELMSVGVNYMREHMASTARVHYAVIDSGGIAPNVVQPRAVVRYLVRDRELPDMQALGRARQEDR